MIVRISGILSEVHDGHAVLDRDGIAYEVLACGYACAELAMSRGQEVTLHTLEYLEGSTVGGNLIPRLVGFLHAEDRAFFTKFTTVKGMGVRKAIKALTSPTRHVAAAIEAGDAKTLSGLPGIGKRMADQIIAELKGKLTEFALGDPDRPAAAAAEPLPGEGWSAAMRDALEVMVAALGERRPDAQRWLERAMQLNPDDHAADEWVRLAYKVRSTG
jgi:Holliday junction DNA helicase RuvA